MVTSLMMFTVSTDRDRTDTDVSDVSKTPSKCQQTSGHRGSLHFLFGHRLPESKLPSKFFLSVRRQKTSDSINLSINRESSKDTP